MRKLPFRVCLLSSLICALVLGCSNERSLVRAKFYNDTLMTKDMITITIRDGMITRRFEPSSLHSHLGAWSTPEIETRSSGTLFVEYQVQDAHGALVSTGEIALDLRKDWRWGIDIFHREENPIHSCMGCFGYRAYPIIDPVYMTSETDSVFILWGGNSISNPVEY